MNENTQRVISLYDGKRSSVEIAKLVGLSPRYVRKLAKKHDLQRLSCGAQAGSANHQFVSGRRIGLDGYVIVTAPDGHPHARKRPNRTGRLIPEHRLVMEKVIGRYLSPTEVVDHIDGLTLHNHPSNLRIFESNREHLSETLAGRTPNWSQEGRQNLIDRHRKEIQQVDNYRQRKVRGEIRLRQILLAALKLGIDSPYLLGTSRHLEKAQIDCSSHSKIKRALAQLYLEWGWDHALSEL